MFLDDRSRDILKAIIVSYIHSGEPVGSRTITKRFEIGVSPATVRNIMADLEEMGYLAQPHTSAGRVPTDKAYRLYIDTLLEVRPPSTAPEQRILDYPLPTEDFQNMMRGVTKLLSGLSHYVGVVVAPKPADTIYKHIEFVKLSGRRALVIFVSDAGIVHNRLLVLDADVTQKDLDRATAFLNHEMTGRTLRDIRARLVAMMAEDKSHFSMLMVKLVKAGSDAMTEEEGSEGELFIGGLPEFFDIPDFREADKMKTIFAAFEEKDRLVRLLDGVMEADGVKVFIGLDNPYFGMDGVSLVVARYKGEGNVIGSLGVIGPTRMPYQTVIPIVDCTARLIGRLLSER